MAKQKKSHNYLYVADPNELNVRFYKRYDENFLFNKAIALALVLEDKERFKAQAAEFQDIDSSRINDKFFESLRAELHFTEMHQFEGFFALLIAIFQDEPHWIYLTDYTTKEMKDAIELFIGVGEHPNIKALTNGRITTEREFIANAVYATYEPREGVLEHTWNANLNNIAWLIRHMAERYIAGSEYNAYKHGLRVMTGHSSFGLRLENPPGNPVGPLRILASSEDSISFLELKKQVIQLANDNATEQNSAARSIDNVRQSAEEKKQITVNRAFETTKHFNPQESIVYLSYMNRLLTTIKRTRLAILNEGETIDELTNFVNLDKDQLIALSTKSRFTSSFSV